MGDDLRRVLSRNHIRARFPSYATPSHNNQATSAPRTTPVPTTFPCPLCGGTFHAHFREYRCDKCKHTFSLRAISGKGDTLLFPQWNTHSHPREATAIARHKVVNAFTRAKRDVG